MTRRVMITGAAGQLGFELQRTAPTGTEILALDIEQLDLTDAAAVDACVAGQMPSVIINCAAYTAVDRAESQPKMAEAVNVTAVKALAIAAKQHGARMIQISTDFVFGAGNGVPWTPSDLTDPQSVYGRTKRDGERAVLDVLGSDALVIRTAWLYSAHGGNFVKTMLRLMAERDDFAVAIQEEGVARGLLTRRVPVLAIPTTDYPTPATRPSYSVLDKKDTVTLLGITPTHWRVNVRHMLDELLNV